MNLEVNRTRVNMLIRDALNAADDDVDFTKYDFGVIQLGVNVSDYGMVGLCGHPGMLGWTDPSLLVTNSGEVLDGGVAIFTAQAHVGTNFHDISHNLGGIKDGKRQVPCLYDHDLQAQPGPEIKAAINLGYFDPLSCHYYKYELPPPGLCSWTKIRLGWMDPSKIRTVNLGETTEVMLGPLEDITDDRVAAVIASMRAMGQDRTAGIYAGNVLTSQKPRINGQEYAVAQVWAAGAAVAASQKFIGQRAFKEIHFKNGLPWVFVFEGLPARVDGERTGPVNPDDGTVVIVGDLGASYDKNRTLFRSVALAKSAQMDIADGGGRIVLHDFYGNPMLATAGSITVPLNDRGYFLRTDGSAGSFGRLLAALAQATIAGLDPVEIVAWDLTRRFPPDPGSGSKSPMS